VLCNFLALLGWSPGGDREKFDMDFLTANFDLSRIGKTNAKFDRVKLASFNKDGIAALPAPEFAARWRAWCEQYAPEFLRKLKGEQFDLLATALQPRAKSFADAAEQGSFVVKGDEDIEYDPKAVEKVLRKGEPNGLKVLGDVSKTLSRVEPFEPGAIQSALDAFAAASGVGMGQVAQPLRVALTGTAVSPPIAETLAILGKQAVERRVIRCLERCEGAAG
jgi:glutamyl-tRNA synthetase